MPNEERRGFVRFPITLYVDKIEFEPEEFVGKHARTAYDLEITEYDAKALYAELGKRLETYPMTPIRIRVIGRLTS